MKYLFEETSTKAFELAYFIHLNRQSALQITKDAWSALSAHLKPQRKRFYYRLRGRSMGGVEIKARTKISLEEAQKLQSLVYIRSEHFEKEQETKLTPRDSPAREINLSDEDWLVRFVKHVAAIIVTRSSFYATLGVGRVIFNYPTEEAATIYDAIIQDSNRMKDAPYFRKRKSEVFMKGLKERFGDLLQTQVVAHGEERFKCRSDGASFATLINQCLDLFTPWNTDCVLPAQLNPINEPIDELSFQGDDPEKEHPIEARRMHTLIHPSCFQRLTAALEMASPNERLEVPRFFLQGSETGSQSGTKGPSGNNPASGSDRTPSPLTNEELAEVETAVEKQNWRRKRATSDVISVLVDGVERETIKLNQNPARWRVDESARLIEIKSRDAEGELLLGSLLLDYQELSQAMPPKEYSLRLPRGIEILLKLSPFRDPEGEFSGAEIEVSLRTGASSARLAAMMDTIREDARALWRRPAFVLSMLAILAIGSTIVFLVMRRHAPRQEYIAQVQPQPSPLSSSRTQIGQAGENTPPKTAQLLPSRANRSTSSSGETKGNGTPEEGTRTLPGETARELAAVSRVYVAESKSEFDGKVRAAFIDAIARDGKIKVASEADADAYLYLDLRRQGSATRIEARLTNRNGMTLWNDSRAVARDDEMATAARAMARDLALKLAQ
jgi:hypothetical protein